jgi:hypothetical protein
LIEPRSISLKYVVQWHLRPMTPMTRVSQPSCDIRQPQSNSTKVRRLRGGTTNSKNVIHS